MRLRGGNNERQLRLNALLIAIDIDSTLHDYWPCFASIARERFGVDLPYDAQRTWGIAQLRTEQLRWCIEQTHSEQYVLSAEPYPGAVEIVNGWAAVGHTIHIASHRSPESRPQTEQWLAEIGLQYDELHCTHAKVPMLADLGTGLLIDDSPDNLTGALDTGIRAATIRHPWNAELCETEDVFAGDDWHSLSLALSGVLADV